MRVKRWIGGYVRKGVYIIDRTIEKVRYRVSTKRLTERAAVAELERFELDPRRYVGGSDGGLRIEIARADYIKAARTRLTGKHCDSMAKHLERWVNFLRWYQVTTVEGVTQELGEKYLTWRKEHGIRQDREVGASMLNQELFALKSMFRWLRETERISETFDPLRKVRQLKVKGNIRPHRVVDAKDIEKVIGELRRRAAHGKGDQFEAHEHPWGELVQALYGTAARYDSGVRAQVIENERKVRFPQKGSDWVEVSVDDDTLEAAKICAGMSLPRDSGQQLNRRLETACEATGVSKFTVHDLRVSAATHLHRTGVPLRQLQKLLGHADMRTTTLYVRADEEIRGPSLTQIGQRDLKRTAT